MNKNIKKIKYEILFDGRLKRKILTFSAYLKRKRRSKESNALFGVLRNKILKLGNVEERPNEGYIAYLYNNLIFCSIWFRRGKKTIRINIENIKNLNDLRGWAIVVPPEVADKSYYFDISKKEDIPYAISLIMQAY